MNQTGKGTDRVFFFKTLNFVWLENSASTSILDEPSLLWMVSWRPRLLQIFLLHPFSFLPSCTRSTEAFGNSICRPPQTASVTFSPATILWTMAKGADKIAILIECLFPLIKSLHHYDPGDDISYETIYLFHLQPLSLSDSHSFHLSYLKLCCKFGSEDDSAYQAAWRPHIEILWHD